MAEARIRAIYYTHILRAREARDYMGLPVSTGHKRTSRNWHRQWRCGSSQGPGETLVLSSYQVLSWNKVTGGASQSFKAEKAPRGGTLQQRALGWEPGGGKPPVALVGAKWACQVCQLAARTS